MNREEEKKIKEFLERISLFVNKFLPAEYNPLNPSSKVIHDPVWGSNLFYPWEIAVIDSPLFQRLRRIHQTGTAFFTYPSSTHDRFCHSLGVTVLASRLLKQLKEKLQLVARGDLIGVKDIYEVRLAGLLHDIGHCFFSHTAEQVFGQLEIFKLLKDNYPILQKTDCHPHEIFGYFILSDQRFKDFWENSIAPLIKYSDHKPCLENIAGFIVGYYNAPEKRFLKEVISGSYDADKLEYFCRDGYVSGISIVYDIERFFYKINVESTEKYSGTTDEHRLIMDIGGVTTVEQLIFSKMMLFSYIYHHQKVRAADCLIRDIVLEILNTEPEKSPIKIEHPCDFLNYTDYDLLTTLASDNKGPISSLLEKLQNRQFNKRCFVISKEYVKGLEADNKTGKDYGRLTEAMRDILGQQLEMRKELLKLINKKIGNRFNLFDIHIDLPKLPPLEEASSAPIRKPNGEIDSIAEHFQFKRWQETYDLKKLKGHIFVKGNIKESQEVAENYLYEKYNLRFSDLSWQLAKVKK